jgi:mannose-1-phosphate guanylyltransferase
MKALVLAAGKGSRLGDASGGLPKPLVDVGGTSPLELNVGWVAAYATECIWINVHEGADQIRSRIGDAAAGVPVRYSREPTLLGTAGAWKRLEAEWRTTSLVLYGDNVMKFELHSLIATHRRMGLPATIAIFDPSVNANTGIGGGRVALADGRVTRFTEGAEQGLVNAGAYCLEPEIAALIPSGFRDFGRDVLPELAAAGLLAGHLVEPTGYCMGVDSPELLTEARRMLRERSVVL